MGGERGVEKERGGRGEGGGERERKCCKSLLREIAVDYIN